MGLKNEKKSFVFRRRPAIKFFIGRGFLLVAFLLAFTFLNLLFFNIHNVDAYHDATAYEKLFSDTLSSDNWNDLFDDFVNTWLPVSMTGPLGIGITNPNASLDVNTAAPVNYTILAGNKRIGNVALPSEDADVATKGYLDAALVGGSGMTVGYWGLDGFNLFASSTIWNVGIGTTAPSYKLDVRGTASTDGINSQIGYNIDTVARPIAPTFAYSSGGSVDDGTHWYFVTYVTAIGETSLGTYAQATVSAPNNTVTLTIPVSTDTRVISRKIYRSKAGGQPYTDYLLATVANNTATEYIDTTADADLTGSPGVGYFRINTTSNYITINGTRAFFADSQNTFLGIGTGASLTVGGRTTLFGAGAGSSITGGYDNNFFGLSAGRRTTTGSSNNFFGYNGGYYNTTGSSNTALGHDAGFYNVTGVGNVAIGAFTIFGTTLQSGSYQTAIGSQSLRYSYGNYNVAVGYEAGNTITSGNYNIMIGKTANPVNPTDSNKLNIGNTIYGDLSTGRIGIGTTAPTATLEVNTAEVINYTILAGGKKIGDVALPTEDADVVTKGYVDSTFVVAGTSTIAIFAGVTASTYNGDNGGTAGYAQAHSVCAVEYPGAHVCATFELLNTIQNGGAAPTQDAWIFSGPPGYTALANDCDARTNATSAAYGTYWQKPATGYPEGRGLLLQCNNTIRFACCL